MLVRERVEEFLDKAGFVWERLSDTSWHVRSEEAKPACGFVVFVEPPLVVIRLNIMKNPEPPVLPLYARLLELNATGLRHGAFGLENGNIILVDTLELETMDYSEFMSSISAMCGMVRQNYNGLVSLATGV